MQFDAYSISSAVKQILSSSLSGRVHSVFQNAINIAFDRELIGVTRRHYGNSPFNLLLDTAVTDHFNALWTVGASVCVQENQLVFSNKIIISLNNASTWMPDDVPAKSDIMLSEYMLNRFLFAVAMLPERGMLWPLMQPNMEKPEKISSLLLIVDRLISACKNHDETAITEIIPLVIGCGEGLTPSGDDFICGFVVTLMTAMRCTVLSPPLSSVIKCLLENVDYHQKKTTWPSQMMLKGVIKGWITEPAAEIIADVFEGKAPRQNALCKMWSIGHGSGADMVAGIFHALKLLCHDQSSLNQRGAF